MTVPTAPEDRKRRPVVMERREQAVARAGAYLAKWADSGDPDDLRELERAERALREALEAR
jgi:hypothetical protein